MPGICCLLSVGCKVATGSLDGGRGFVKNMASIVADDGWKGLYGKTNKTNTPHANDVECPPFTGARFSKDSPTPPSGSGFIFPHFYVDYCALFSTSCMFM